MATTPRSEDLIAEARAAVEGHAPTEAEVLAYRLADALEVAEKRATEAEAERDRLRSLRDRWQETVSAPSFVSAVEAEARAYHESACAYQQELAAALAVIEKAREMVSAGVRADPDRVLRVLSSVPADVLRERDDRMRAEGWDECFSTAYDGPFTRDPNNPYRQTEEEK